MLLHLLLTWVAVVVVEEEVEAVKEVAEAVQEVATGEAQEEEEYLVEAEAEAEAVVVVEEEVVKVVEVEAAQVRRVAVVVVRLVSAAVACHGKLGRLHHAFLTLNATFYFKCLADVSIRWKRQNSCGNIYYR
ncbi:hypothetical protein Fot_23495 [Forsythia ovata]|uniref:Secreted protein n=1 Tax=Forsythia ovata TaxID=205694 RepID=A0ABD1V0P1_9LAMI